MMKDIDVNEYGKVEKPNPIVDKFYIMTREDSVSASQIKPTTGQQEQIDKIASVPDFKKMSTEDKTIIWRFRYS